MFQKRLKTALLLIPIVLLIVFSTYSHIFCAGILLLTLLAAHEWFGLVPLSGRIEKWVCAIALGVLMAVCHLSMLGTWVLYGAALLWCLMAYFVYRYPTQAYLWHFNGVVLLMMFILLLGFFVGMTHIRMMPHGSALVFYMLLLVWGADTGAYCIGKQFGKRKLLPKVSPGKTVEGLLGAVTVDLIICIIGQMVFFVENVLTWYIISLSMVFVSILGDLFISMLKRRVNLKDTGTLLPGHGGILDRIDSLLSVSVFFALGIQLITFKV